MAKSHLRLVRPRTVNGTVPPRRRKNAELRTREYLTEAEVERLMKAARDNRYGLRDATMILVAYRHGLRAAELVDLRWDQVELGRNAVLHVRRVKQGVPSVHPLQGDEMRALRELKRSADSPFVFTSERGAPFTTAGFGKMIARAGRSRQAQGRSPAHASARLRLRPGEQRARHPRTTSLFGPQEYPAYGTVHGIKSDAVQGFLALETRGTLGARAARRAFETAKASNGHGGRRALPSGEGPLTPGPPPDAVGLDSRDLAFLKYRVQNLSGKIDDLPCKNAPRGGHYGHRSCEPR